MEIASPDRQPLVRHRQHRLIHLSRERKRGHAPSGQVHALPRKNVDGIQGEGKLERENIQRRSEKGGKAEMPGGKELERSPAMARE